MKVYLRQQKQEEPKESSPDMGNFRFQRVSSETVDASTYSSAYIQGNKIRDINIHLFSQIPDILEVEEMLAQGRYFSAKSNQGSYKGNFVGSLALAYDLQGFLTDRQLARLREIKEKQKSGVKSEQASSEHFGNIGEKYKAILNLTGKKEYQKRERGKKPSGELFYCLKFRNQEGDIMVAFHDINETIVGSYDSKEHRLLNLTVGENYHFMFKVTKHDVFDHTKQTTINLMYLIEVFDSEFK